MKKLPLILAFIFFGLFTQAQKSEPCFLRCYIQIGYDVVNIKTQCDKNTKLDFTIQSIDYKELSRFSYVLSRDNEPIQVSLANFPPGTYFVTVSDGFLIRKFTITDNH